MGLKQGGGYPRWQIDGLSAEPLVGLKLLDLRHGVADRLLSAEPLVGLKRNDGMVSSKALATFQPNPSWV